MGGGRERGEGGVGVKKGMRKRNKYVKREREGEKGKIGQMSE